VRRDEEIQRMREPELDADAGVRLDLPSGDANLVAQGQALANIIKESLVKIESTTTLDDIMHSLRGR